MQKELPCAAYTKHSETVCAFDVRKQPEAKAPKISGLLLK